MQYSLSPRIILVNKIRETISNSTFESHFQISIYFLCQFLEFKDISLFFEGSILPSFDIYRLDHYLAVCTMYTIAHAVIDCWSLFSDTIFLILFSNAIFLISNYCLL